MNKIKEYIKSHVVAFSVCLIISGIIALSYNYLCLKKSVAFEKMNMVLYTSSIEVPEVTIEEDPVQGVIESPSEEEEVVVEEPEIIVEEPKKEYVAPTYYYIGMIKIPKIGLEKGFVDINSKDNTVSKNVTIVKGSNYPDVDKGNFILAAHSGNSYVSYFNTLYKLKTGDNVYIYYDDIEYVYTITSIYEQEKTGVIGIYRDYEKTTLTLVTCTKNNKKTQTIYIAELIDKNEQ